MVPFFSWISLLAFETNHVHGIHASRYSWETSFTFIPFDAWITLWSNYPFETWATFFTRQPSISNWSRSPWQSRSSHNSHFSFGSF